MGSLTQSTLPLFEPSTLTQHLKSHLSDDGFRETKLSSGPTRYEPGTPGKIDILAARLEAGEPLWHPQDAQQKRRRIGWESDAVPM